MCGTVLDEDANYDLLGNELRSVNFAKSVCGGYFAGETASTGCTIDTLQ